MSDVSQETFGSVTFTYHTAGEINGPSEKNAELELGGPRGKRGRSTKTAGGEIGGHLLVAVFRENAHRNSL